MKLTIVFTVLNQFELARTAISLALQNLSDEILDGKVQLLIIDNGSDTPFEFRMVNGRHKYIPTIVRHEKSIGVYPTFWDALPHATGDVIAFFHSDFIVAEKDWDARVMNEFIKDPKLGMIGFIGSNEIDSAGGRGLGTTSNFLGGSYKDSDGLANVKTWQGSPAEPHGKRGTGFTPAAVVDGCSMIFRKKCLEQIAMREKFPPHHFYDKLLSCEVREHGWKMGVLGIGCDHISGQTVNQEPKYASMAEEWSRAHVPEHAWGGHPGAWSWDQTVYEEAQRQWIYEYREKKHLIPCRV
jgi:hypothetical protein